MKKFISVFLCTVVFTVNVIFMPYAITVYASDFVGNVVKSISFDNVVKMVKSLYKVGYNVATTGSGDGVASSKALDSIWGEDSAVNKWLQTKLFPFMDANRNIDLTNPDSPITYDKDKQLVEFNPTFTTELNQQLQDSIHALDGYYLFEPEKALTFTNVFGDVNFKSDEVLGLVKELITNSGTLFSDFMPGKNSKLVGLNDEILLFIDASSSYISSWDTVEFPNSSSGFTGIGGNVLTINNNNVSQPTMWGGISRSIYGVKYSVQRLKNSLNVFYGNPFKVFYSFQDAKNYLNKGRAYVPQLPSVGFKVNIKYINNTTNLPDITYNITTENKTETEIQNQFDTTFNNYLNDLNDFTDGGGGSTITPTPTPSGGGSGGDFGDGTTPTPKPDFTDGSLTDTNTLLQKILDKLTEFSANHDKLAKTITAYIEKNDGKLEEILLAIQALSDGKTETEQNGCKYDFTALSKYLTDLWNNSDKKFDEMVKLLEENNKYQQKLVDSLNEIKALLIADTVMDFFKDRSQETAEKAKDKFPTSIPWDISLVLNSMSAEPKNPKFSLPIKIESFKINETIDIDLSTDEWEKLAKTCRYILSVTFILFLIHLSRKLFSNGGDD